MLQDEAILTLPVMKKLSLARSELLSCLAILIMALVTMLPVFIDGFPGGFDATRHYRWTSQLIDAIREGPIYPRWLPTANNGQGSPVPIYHPPLTFYVGAGLSLAGNVLTGMALSCWLGLTLSGLAIYKLARPTLPRAASLFAALLYMAAPYHVYDLYHGTAIPEFWSFAFVPFLIDSIRSLSVKFSWIGVGYLALAYSLLLFTHVPVAFLTSLVLPIYALALTRNPRKLLSIAGGLTLGGGLAAIFILPVVFERGYVKLFFKFDYRDYFLFEHLDRAFDNLFPINQSSESHLLDTNAIGLALLVLFGICTLILSFQWRRREHGGDPQDGLLVAIWLTTVLSFLMTARLMAGTWKTIPGLPMLFFPCRWLVVASAGTTFLTAVAIYRLKWAPKWRRLIFAGLISAAILFNCAISFFAIVQPPRRPEVLEAGLSRRDVREYRPVWWNAEMNLFAEGESVIVQDGEASVTPLDEFGVKQSYAITAGAASVLTLRPLYFPGWTARIDGQSTAIGSSPEGNIQVSIMPGEHELELRFEDTWPRALGKGLSAISLALLMMIAYLGSRSYRRLHNTKSCQTTIRTPAPGNR